MTNASVRINKYIALHAGLSRREADEHLEQGRVTINGKVAQLGTQVTDGDTIAIDGTPLGTATHIYLALHKPAGYVCSRKRQGDAPTIYELLPAEYHALKPVGRLDKDSSGILLLTNDGDFAHRMTHPSFHKTKIYEVRLDQPLQPLHQQMISDFGVMLEDGKSQFTVARLSPQEHSDGSKRVTGDGAAPTSSLREDGADRLAGPASSDLRENSEGIFDDGSGDSKEKTASETQLNGEDKNTFYQITMREGRNRQIRRTFAALGYTVTALHRTQFGNYSLANLQAGKFKPISLPQQKT